MGRRRRGAERAGRRFGNLSASTRKIAITRGAVRTAMRKMGIGDPSGVAAAVRKRMIPNECEHPEQPAQLWRSQAITEVATTDSPAEFTSGMTTRWRAPPRVTLFFAR